MKTKEEIDAILTKIYYDNAPIVPKGSYVLMDIPVMTETDFRKAMDEYASQFQQEWIPVEVRLPDEGRDVYTTVMFNEEKPFVVTSFIRHGNTKRWAHNHGFVTAWQYIKYPQPYNPTKS